MQKMQGSHALIQFSPVPERMEFLNVGVVLAVPECQFLGVRFAKSHSKLARYFGRSDARLLHMAQQSLESRLNAIFQSKGSIDALAEFAQKRANELRISPFLPASVVDPAAVLDRLFFELVGEDVPRKRQPRVFRLLREAFVDARVDGLVEENPDPVELPDLGVSIKAQFGYQNGAYNLLDAMRFGSDRDAAMKEAGKRALQGNALWKLSQRSDLKRQLCVVADFGNQPQALFDFVGDQLDQNHVRLYRLDQLSPLVEDIKSNADLHGHALN